MDTNDYSTKTGEIRSFGIVDYVIFSSVFVLSAVVGFYHAFRDRNINGEENFHLGGRSMHPIPVSMSLTVTFLSALTVLGIPAEVYTNGTMYVWIVVAMFFAVFAAVNLYIPVFYKLQNISCFEYLELRFGVVVKISAILVFLLQTLVYMGLALYAPSLAFEAVTGVSLWGCLIGTSAVCTLYTALGGMKTVLWTDSLQFVIMIAGMLCLLIGGSMFVGGFDKAWDIANDAGRTMLTEVSPDPRIRHSVWTVAIGGSFLWMYLYGVNQAQVQRACCLPNLRKMKIALWLNYVGLLVIVILVCMIGVVMFAMYSDCHPVKYGLVSRNDQLIPLLVLDVLGKVPGLSGIFMTCVFSGGLSSMSSGLNAMSAIIEDDVIKPIFAACGHQINNRKGIILAKILVVIIGLGNFGFAVLFSRLQGLFTEFAYIIFSLTGGPLLGIFTAGMFFPWTNKHGALIGFILSFAFMSWLAICSIIEKPPRIQKRLTFSTAGCNWNASNFATVAPVSQTTTLEVNTTFGSIDAITEQEPIIWNLYQISYMWYTGLGMLLTVVISIFTSFLTGYTKPETLDSRLMCPVIDILFPCLPEYIRRPLMFGVVYQQDYGEANTSVELKNCLKSDPENMAEETDVL